MDFQTVFSEKINAVDHALKQFLADMDAVPPTITEAMRYSVFAGGKRIRPVLLLASFEMFQPDSTAAMPFACALEMIHTYSLIHDDLPAMDNSDLRRGRKTNHIVFGEAMAVLAGDALLNFAFETMLAASHIEAVSVLRAAAYIAKSAGISGMIGGQVLDIESENKIISQDELRVLHEKKTGGLICAAACGGAILSGADETQITALEQFACHLGLAFQIKDDILDVEGDAAALGKPTGGDNAAHKNTYVTLYGLQEAKKLLLQHTQAAKDTLSQFGERADFLHSLTEYLLRRDK